MGEISVKFLFPGKVFNLCGVILMRLGLKFGSCPILSNVVKKLSLFSRHTLNLITIFEDVRDRSLSTRSNKSL